MPEPTVPSLSAQILERKPKLSGACPSRSLALMFGAGLPLAVVAGVVAHYLGILVGWLGAYSLLIALTPSKRPTSQRPSPPPVQPRSR